MEKRRLVNSAEMKKEKSKKISSKQLEARITAFTIILAVIVMNILWWTGTQFLELNNNHNITETARPFHQQVMQHK
jgi:ABC-type phosphate/phosphonate transport system permease subunit